MVKENSLILEAGTPSGGYAIKMSSDLIAYLSNDYAYRNPNRYSRIRALQDLLRRFQKARQASTQMDVNIAQLVKPGDGVALLFWPSWTSFKSIRSWRCITW